MAGMGWSAQGRGLVQGGDNAAIEFRKKELCPLD